MNSDNQQLTSAEEPDAFRNGPSAPDSTLVADTVSPPPGPLPVSPLLLPFRSSAFSAGFLLLVISGTLFLLYTYLTNDRPSADGNNLMVMIHYGMAVLFSGFLVTNGYLKFRRPTYAEERPARWLGLLLWLISAYALNREMAVFQQSTTWLCIALVLIGLAMTAYGWKDVLSVRMQQLLYAVLAIGFCLFAYMAVYVAWLYLISVPMLIGLGLSIHTFVPLAIAVALGKRLWYDSKREEHLRLGIKLGLWVPMVVIVLFLVSWYRTLHRIERVQLTAATRRTSDLPDWVLMAQQLKPGWITNRLLLNKRVYDDSFFFGRFGWGLGSLTAHDDRRQHDPLVVIAMLLFPPDALSESDQRRLLNVVAEDRHGTEEKFWSGRHLTTEQVITQVRIWPTYRLSYTEKTLFIRNEARSTTEEALYTFQLPAGSTVSSMALWVNGQEQPAYLTTVAKADSAYRTVVGLESRVMARDPSVVYWQEGNRVTLRVFPCRAGQDRRVKLGITSPLRLEGNQLVYQNPVFKGPDPSSADELVNVTFASAPDGLDVKSPWFGTTQTANGLTHEGTYTPAWTLRMTAPAPSAVPFVLDGQAYRMTPYRPTLTTFVSKDVYLDINAAWTPDDYRAALNTARRNRCPAWVFDDGLTLITPQNSKAVYDRLSAQAFSLFPVYRLHDPATALLITKGTTQSPTLSDLKRSPFAQHFSIISRQTVPVRTFCLSESLSPYLKTLAELRVLNVMHGSTNDLLTQLTETQQFTQLADDTSQIVLPEAGVVIQAVPQAKAPAVQAGIPAPDHLVRLFTYNQLLQRIGRHYFNASHKTDSLIQLAQRAHVVSPLSSLVVLETAGDYDRFGIDKDRLGLDNATLKQEGAVPEPHEWALLLLVSGVVGWLIWRKRYGLA